MRKIFLSAIALFFIISCTSQKTKSEQESSDKTAKIMIPESGCFASFSGRDTILLKIEVFPNVVTGTLKYNIWEKDKNEGTIEGKLEGDKLFADYTFLSEGKTSVRQVAFQINADKVMEGFAEQQENNGKMIFNNKKDIDFSKGIKLIPIDCIENDYKFKIK